MARSCRLALLGLALSTLGAIRAQADEPPPPVRSCIARLQTVPREKSSSSRVRARTGKKDGSILKAGAPFELFEIDLTPGPERTRGRLTTYLRGAYPTVARSRRRAVAKPSTASRRSWRSLWIRPPPRNPRARRVERALAALAESPTDAEARRAAPATRVDRVADRSRATNTRPEAKAPRKKTANQARAKATSTTSTTLGLESVPAMVSAASISTSCSLLELRRATPSWLPEGISLAVFLLRRSGPTDTASADVLRPIKRR